MYGATPLHVAAAYGHAEAVTTILEMAPDPQSLLELVTKHGSTPLALAKAKGHEEITRTKGIPMKGPIARSF